jgi:hypothetical protein
MEKTLSLYIDNDELKISNNLKIMMKKIFSGSRINFLLGAGFSANILHTLNNNEIIFDSIRKINNDIKGKVIIESFLYWKYFYYSIYPINNILCNPNDFEIYNDFSNILYNIFSIRSNPVLDKQFNIFTTNYDPIIELMFDNSLCICNDGFEGRINPVFSTDNYSKSYYRQAIFSNRKSEIPSVNLIKIHGSITWEKIDDSTIKYKLYYDLIKKFHDKFHELFDVEILEEISSRLKAETEHEVTEKINQLISSNIFNDIIEQYSNYEEMLNEYKKSFFIVNPTKEKFNDTLLNKNYYELLRIFSNELEKENTVLITYGFSFRDEHILDLIKRSMINPSLKILIFCYKKSEIYEFNQLFVNSKNNNISYIFMESEKDENGNEINTLTLDKLNEIFSCVCNIKGEMNVKRFL